MNQMLIEVALIGFTKALAAALVGALVVYLTSGCGGPPSDASDRPTGSAWFTFRS